MSAVSRVLTCAAPPIYEEGRLTSKGSKTTRICFDQLPAEKYRIAGTVNDCCLCNRNLPFHVQMNGEAELVWLNLKSMAHRFHLSEEVILAASKEDNLQRIIQLVADRITFQPPESSIPQGETDMIPMLSMDHKGKLAPLGEIARQAKDQNRDIRLSKHLYDIPESISVTREGFIAIDQPRTLGKGAYSVVKQATTQTQMPIVRRICNQPHNRERIFWNLELFKGKKGVIDTLGTAVYVNKKGKLKAVSYHPVYEKDLFDLLKNNDPLSERDVWDIAHHLLLGLVEVATRGMHGDITAENVLIRKVDGRMEAVITDLDTFSRKDEAKGTILANIWAAPETIDGPIKGEIPPDEKRDVWPIGAMLYHILQHPAPQPITLLPWVGLKPREVKRAFPHQTQEKMDSYIAGRKFSPPTKQLLQGMLRFNPIERWTAQQALDFFEQNFQPK